MRWTHSRGHAERDTGQARFIEAIERRLLEVVELRLLQPELVTTVSDPMYATANYQRFLQSLRYRASNSQASERPQ